MKKFKNIFAVLGVLALMSAMTACSDEDNFLFDNGECDPELSEYTTAVKFHFKKHRQALHSVPGKEADVFENTVGSVHLFVYDAKSGELVLEKMESADNLRTAYELDIKQAGGTGRERCYLPVKLLPGDYRFVAWCGLDRNDHNNAFSLIDGSRASYSHCAVKLDESGRPVRMEKYESVYHGMVPATRVDGDETAPTVIEMGLTKDNNDIAVLVQHATINFEEGDYTVVYTDANGRMDFHSNDLTEADRLEYLPHTTSLLNADTEYEGAPYETNALIAHISTSRLLQSHSKDARLEVRNREGNTVFSIPFIQYLLQMQTLTTDGQYYLDCEDTYNCNFFLTGESGTWTPAMIHINNWVLTPDQGGIL